MTDLAKLGYFRREGTKEKYSASDAPAGSQGATNAVASSEAPAVVTPAVTPKPGHLECRNCERMLNVLGGLLIIQSLLLIGVLRTR